jgi:Histidine kinase
VVPIPVRSEPDGAAPKADVEPPNGVAVLAAAPAESDQVGFDDRPLMVFGSLAFGISIPLLTDLYGPIGITDGRFWMGVALFIALAFAIWGGNRWLLFKQRQHFDWFNHPVRKLLMLVTANVLYTAPITVLGLLAWFEVAGLPVDRNALQVVVLTNVICVLFVTHAYETLFLIRERESDMTRVERLQRLRAQAELAALKAQVDPHFLFNSLNSLGHLITHDAQRGREFCDALAQMYRYVLDSRQKDLALLAEELEFLRLYYRLLQLRFGAAVQLEIEPALDEAAHGDSWRIAPLAIQTLLENAVKHNQASADAPLLVTLRLEPETIAVTNRRRARSSALPTSGLGLANLDERCRLLTGRPLDVRADHETFAVLVPLARRQ